MAAETQEATSEDGHPPRHRRRRAVVITSYATLRRDGAALAAVGWDTVVLDEGHVLANVGSKVFKAAASLRARHRLVLTGTQK